MKKICIVFLGKFNIDARCINMSASILKTKKFSLSIISIKDNKLIQSQFKDIQFYNIQISNKKIFKYIDFYLQVKKILQKNNFDILIASDLYSLSSICSVKGNIVYDSREIYSALEAHKSKPLYRWFWWCYEKYYLRFVNNLIVTAESDSDFLKKLYPKNNVLFHTVYNFPKYQKYIKYDLLRNKFNISPEQKIILYQGVIQKGRGIAKLINSVELSNGFVGVIIGNGIMKAHYKNTVTKKKLDHRVFFVDAVSYNNLFQYTASADIGWLMIQKGSISNKFALPNKLFEYVLMGLPVISNNIKNIATLVQTHNLGVVVNNEKNIDEYVGALNKITNINFDSNKLHRVAAANFTWEKQETTFLSIF